MKRVAFIDSLRGIACLIVLFSHIVSVSSIGKYVNGCGKIGVWLFMVLAGYLLMESVIRDDEFRLSKYIRKKAVRIYPPYIAILAIGIAFNVITFKQAYSNVLLYGSYGHLWYMPVIVEMYLAFPLFAYSYLLLKNKKLYLLILISVCAAFSLFFPFTGYQENSIYLYWYLPVFIFGMMVSVINNEYKPRSSALFDVVCLLSCCAIIALTPYFRQLIFNSPPSSFLQNKYLIIGGLWAVILFSLFQTKLLSRLLACKVVSKPLGFISNISYVVYLLHFFVLMYLLKYNLPWPVLALLVLGITIPVSWLINYAAHKLYLLLK